MKTANLPAMTTIAALAVAAATGMMTKEVLARVAAPRVPAANHPQTDAPAAVLRAPQVNRLRAAAVAVRLRAGVPRAAGVAAARLSTRPDGTLPAKAGNAPKKDAPVAENIPTADGRLRAALAAAVAK